MIPRQPEIGASGNGAFREINLDKRGCRQGNARLLGNRQHITARRQAGEHILAVDARNGLAERLAQHGGRGGAISMVEPDRDAGDARFLIVLLAVPIQVEPDAAGDPARGRRGRAGGRRRR